MLKLNDIAKTFNPGTVNEKKALDGVKLHLAPGDFVTVVGSNGAGKSTLFHAIAGVFSRTGGPLCWTGRISPLSPSTSAAASWAGSFRTP